jgi:hypothetical protein
MAVIHEPILELAAIARLRPTQITVGMREVEVKRKAWRRRTANKKDGKFLGHHLIPVIFGPKQRPYIVDHHHLALALHAEGVREVVITKVADLSRLEPEPFWATMDGRGWVHPFDDRGMRRSYRDIPKTLAEMVDDPFRSLAGELRRIGGFAKETVPFSEFLWADFLRRRIKRTLVERDFTRALEKGLALAKSPDANYLPGWCGAVPED